MIYINFINLLVDLPWVEVSLLGDKEGGQKGNEQQIVENECEAGKEAKASKMTMGLANC